jgi:hypothetical protein
MTRKVTVLILASIALTATVALVSVGLSHALATGRKHPLHGACRTAHEAR